MGCFILMVLMAWTWFLTYILMCLLSWMFGFTLTAGIVTGVWLILLVLKLLF